MTHKIQNLKIQREEFQHQLIGLLQKFFTKYITRISQESVSIKEFQKSLYNIAKWSDSKIDKEFSKFLDYTHEKFGIKKSGLEDLLDKVFVLNVQIMASIFGDVEINVPEFGEFWYKCLKYISKYVYENPKNFTDNLKDISKTVIENVIQKYIPILKIINSKKQEDVINYHNFDNLEKSESEGKYTPQQKIRSIKKLNTDNTEHEQREQNDELFEDEQNNTSETSYVKSESIKQMSSDFLPNSINHSSENKSKYKGKEDKHKDEKKEDSEEKYIEIPKKKYDGFKSLKIN
jgi:hypothetical protein